jgi:thiol-disulfide isomerase/thioredoxin
MRYVLMLCVCLALFGLSACGSSTTDNSTGFPVAMITSDGRFDADVCAQKGLSGKALMLESKYCSHCQTTLPIFAQACDEQGVECEILDLADSEQYTKMKSYGVDVRFTPTFIIGCEYFTGVRSKEEYLSYLENIN